MGFTNPAAATGVVTVSGPIAVNSAPSGAAPATTVASLSAVPAVVGSTTLLPALFIAEYVLVKAIVSLQNLLTGAYLELTIQDSAGNIIVGPLFAYGTTGTNTPNATSIDGQEFDLGQLIVPSGHDVDVVIAGTPGASSAWSVNVFYSQGLAGAFPGHIINA